MSIILTKDDYDDTWYYVDPKYPDDPFSPKFDNDIFAMQWRRKIAEEIHWYAKDLHDELDALNNGDKIVSPKSKAHAEEMIRVAESYLKQNG